MPVNNAHNVASLYADPQKQQQGRKANAAQVLKPNAGQQPTKANAAATGGVKVTISAAGRRTAAAAQANAQAGNIQAARQAQANPNSEAANAIRAYENANRANRTPNQQPGPTQKTIRQLGGAA